MTTICIATDVCTDKIRQLYEELHSHSKPVRAENTNALYGARVRYRAADKDDAETEKVFAIVSKYLVGIGFIEITDAVDTSNFRSMRMHSNLTRTTIGVGYNSGEDREGLTFALFHKVENQDVVRAVQ